MSKVKENEYFLRALLNAKSPKQRKNLLKYANRKQVLAISEIFTNFLHGNIESDNPDFAKKFNKQKRLFRVIGFKGRKSWLKRKQAIIELGKTVLIFLRDVLMKLL